MPITTKEAADRKNAKRKAQRAAAKEPQAPMKPNRQTIGRRDPAVSAMSKAELREMFAQAVRNTGEK